MSAKETFVDNMNTVLGRNKVRELVRQANEQGIGIDYTYVMDVKRGSRNPSVEKLEQIVAMLSKLPGFDWVELWMFFIPEYFATHSGNVMKSASNKQTNLSSVQSDSLGPVLTEQEFVSKVTDALMMYHYFDWVKIDKDKMDFDAAGKYMLKQVGPLVGVESSMGGMLDKTGSE